MSECRRCGAKIRFVMTKKGKWMPLDWNAVLVRTDEGTDAFYDEDGNLFRGSRVDSKEEADDALFVPHWSTCPYAEDFRRRKK